MPRDMLWRHPFPGPGLAVRCLGEVNEARLRVLRAADAIVIDEIRSARASTTTIWQAFAVLLPVQERRRDGRRADVRRGVRRARRADRSTG